MQVLQIAALSSTTIAGPTSKGFSRIPTAKQKRHSSGCVDKASVVEDWDRRFHLMDIVWHYIACMKMPDSGLHFPPLSKTDLLMPIIPHSNSEVQRIFSMVSKNKTLFRPSLDPCRTLSGILIITLADTKSAHKFKLPNELLKDWSRLPGSKIRNSLRRNIDSYLGSTSLHTSTLTSDSVIFLLLHSCLAVIFIHNYVLV